MDGLDAFVTTLIITLFPGIVWAKFDARFTRQQKPSDFSFVLNAIMFAVAAYLITYVLYMVFTPLFGWSFDVLGLTGDEKGPLIPSRLLDDIIVATAVSLICAVAWLYFETYKLTSRFLQWIKATYRFGDEDVWDFVLSSSSKKVTFVNVRDHQNKFLYTGYVINFSETGMLREILLNDVSVYNEETGDHLYDMPLLYIARQTDNMTVEFPATDENMKAADDVASADPAWKDEPWLRDPITRA